MKTFWVRIRSYVLTMQIFFVMLAFTAMVALSYMFASSFEKRSLANMAQTAIEHAQTSIANEMREADILMHGITSALQLLKSEGYDRAVIERYFADMARRYNEEDSNNELYALHIYLEGGQLIQVGGDEFSNGGAITLCPWFSDALGAGGKTAVTAPHFCGVKTAPHTPTITYSRLIKNHEGGFLAVVAVTKSFETIVRHINSASKWEGAYAVLQDTETVLLSHPSDELVGQYMDESESGVTKFMDELERDGEFSEGHTYNYKGEPVVVFYKSIGNGWYLGLFTPQEIYYRNTRDMAFFLVVIGVLMALFLSVIITRISRSKRKSDRMTEIILNEMPLASAIWDSDLNMIMCNEEAVRLYGAPGKDHFVSNFFDYSPKVQPSGRSSTGDGLLLLRTALEQGKVNFEWEHKHYVTGEAIPSNVMIVRTHCLGQPVLVSYFRDVREERQRIELLREADKRAMMMLDATPLGITMWDKDCNLIDYNYEAARVIGVFDKPKYRELFMQTAPEYQSSGEKTADKLVYLINETFRTGSVRTKWEHKSVHGEVIPFEATTMRLEYKGSDVVVAYCRDLRDVIAATNKANEADERAQILVDAMPIGANFWTTDMHNVDCNREVVRMFGMSSKQEYLDRFAELSPEYQPNGTLSKDGVTENLKKAFRDGYHRFEWMHRKPDGTPIPCEVTLIRTKHRSGDVVVGFTRDLRELQAAVKNIHRAELAERGNLAKSKFLARMSHEIRTPMNVILGVAEMQLQDDTIPPQHREALMQIYNSSDLLLGIINDILDLSKIEADKMELTPAKYELASLVSDAASINVMRSSKPTEFELRVGENAPACLYGDELRIKQILNNILSNAFKFTDEGQVILEVDVEENDGDNVTLCLVVTDSGTGMSPEELGKLFSEYTRFNLENNRVIEGTGLGMNITQRLIKMMGGKIAVESDLGKGTRVSVRLPQKRVGEQRIGAPLANNLREFRVNSSSIIKRMQFKRDYMPYGRVLIIDDVESNLYVAKGLMLPYGLVVETAGSGTEALKKIRAGEVYDVIFMDHMMPVLDGIQTTKAARDEGYAYPIVALTANAVVGQADVFLKSGFDDFISKPIDVRQLNSVLNKFVRDKQSPETLEKAEAAKAAMAGSVPVAGGAVAPELLAVFARDAVKTLPIFEDAAGNVKNFSNEQLNNFTTAAHGMKSALANIGEGRLSQMAQSLEKAGKDGNRGAVAAQIGNFVKALRGVTAKAEVEGNTRDAAADDEDPDMLRAELASIAAACRDYNERMVADSIARLKQKSWTLETESLIARIESHLLHSNFEEAAELAEGG